MLASALCTALCTVRPRGILAAAALLLCAAGFAAPQDMDELFESPDEVSENGNQSDRADSGGGSAEESGSATDAGSGGAVDLEELTTSPTTVSGNVSAGLGVGAGLIEWPESRAAGGRALPELIRYSGFYDTSVTVSVDSRPQPYLRLFTSVGTSLDSEQMAFEKPTVNELFIDYTLADSVFFRAGKQDVTWGQGRLLENPANLVSRVPDGVAVRGTAPLGRGTVTGVVYSQKKWVAAYGDIDPRSFAWAGLAESTVGPLTLAASGHYHYAEPVASAASVTFGAGPVTVSGEGVRRWDQDDPLGGESSWQALGQLLWRSEDGAWSLLGEYEYDSADAGGGSHLGGLGAVFPSFGGGWRPSVRFKHAFEDNSGELSARLSGSIAPSLNLSVAVPVVYGAPGSYYRQALAESVSDDEDEQYEIPVDNVVSVLLGVRLSFSF